MIRYSAVLLLFFLLNGLQGWGQEQFIVKKNLEPDWLIYTEKGFSDFDASTKPVNTIYFSVNPTVYKGDYLVLTSPNHFSVFLNGALLLDHVVEVNLPMDSLRSLVTSEALFFAVHVNQKIDHHEITTMMGARVTLPSPVDDTLTVQRNTAFRDFVVTGVLVLLIFLVGAVRLNPKLSSDYFSITKIFALRESEDDQFYSRITSANILFYLFTSMIFSLFLMVMGYFLNLKGEFNLQGSERYFDYLLRWGIVSLVVLGLLFIKIVVTFVIALLFGAREVAGFHFLNFIRIALVSVGALTLVLIFYFLLHGQRVGFYNFLYTTLAWILIGWIILFFLKLVNRVRYSVFHIFSYICATEIIPVLIIIKVLYFK